jgi:glycosyltransferase involved in cell wall biosynthesis
MARTIPAERSPGTGGVTDLSDTANRARPREIDMQRSNAGAKKATVLLCGPPAFAVGGGPTHIRNMLASPLAQKFNLIHFECGSRGAESPAKDEPTAAKLIRLLTSPFVLMARIVQIWPQVVHINSALDHKAFWRDCAYLLVCKLFGRKVVFQLHGGSLELLCVNRVVRQIVRTAFSLPDAVVLLASVEVQQFAEQIGMRERLSVIPNAVDVSEYAPAERPHSGQVRHLGFLARLIRTKGVFESIQAVEVLRCEQQFSNIELRIAGSGPEFEAIERYIHERGLEKSVKLLGPIYGRAKVDFLRQIDVLLFPTYHLEGLPYAILESLAAGAPVVTTKVGGIPDVVVDGVHGILIDSREATDVTRALRKLAESPEKLQKMSKDCREWASQRLGLDRLAQKFGELYARVSGTAH